MAKQQAKRRRKRYQPGSAYAGDVRPTGVLGFMGSAAMVRLIFFVMIAALAAGGGIAIFGGNVLRGGSSSGNPQGFVSPDDDDGPSATAQPGATVELKRYVSPPALSIDPAKQYTAVIKTELGDIEVELLADQAPQTVNSFVFLARDSFYDGLTFHYVAPGFSAQAGDPTGTGTGGPGYELPHEAGGTFAPGTLGMANGSEQGTNNGSQFFIALAESEQFDPFTPFGRIISGLDIAEQVAAGTEIQTIEIFEQ